MKKYFLILFYISFFSGCKLDKPAVSEHKVMYSKSQVLDGNSSLIFKDTLSQIHSFAYYLLDAELYFKDSYIILHSHFNGLIKQDGIRIKFKRTDLDLKVFVSTPQFSYQLFFEQKNRFIEDTNIQFVIKVDNSGTYPSLKIWNSVINLQGSVKQNTRFLSLQNLIQDSESFPLFLKSQGRGVRWGLELHKASLYRAKRISTDEL